MGQRKRLRRLLTKSHESFLAQAGADGPRGDISSQIAMGTRSRRLAAKRHVASQAKEAVVALERTTDRVRAFFATVFEPHGITGQQYNVLRILRCAEPEGLLTLTIADRMIERVRIAHERT